MVIITQQQALIAMWAEREQAHLHCLPQPLGNPTIPSTLQSSRGQASSKLQHLWPNHNERHPQRARIGVHPMRAAAVSGKLVWSKRPPRANRPRGNTLNNTARRPARFFYSRKHLVQQPPNRKRKGIPWQANAHDTFSVGSLI